jgi:acetolactate synthase-1/2/3 large subunit
MARFCAVFFLELQTVQMTLAEALIATLKAHGVKFLFGVPGGGSSLDLIAAADKAGMAFILCRGETSAALAASVVGELTGTPGVVLTAIGPGAASAVNGVAYAHLERAPLILFCDAPALGEDIPPHQVFDLKALFQPIAKACHRMVPETGVAPFDDLVALVLRKPYGPALVELSASDAALPVDVSLPVNTTQAVAPTASVATHEHGIKKPSGDLNKACALLSQSLRPVLLAGLQTCSPGVGAALRQFAERLGCPILTSYKAKGVIADDHPQMIGHFTGAAGEAEAIRRADLIIWVGVDPVELIAVPWRHKAPLLALVEGPGLEYPAPPETELFGFLPQEMVSLAAASAPSAWEDGEISALRDALAQRLSLPARSESGQTGLGRTRSGGTEHTAESVIEAVIASCDDETSFTIDAGAHMISAMARIQVREARQVLKSTGLSTMGFALPAAIAASLVAPQRRVIAFTGDGGLMMCLAELSTAARLGCRLTVVVLNDAALSLIDIKQQRRQLQPIGVRYPAVDFAAAAVGMGCGAWKVGCDQPLGPAIDAALAHEGAGLIDVTVDPAGYGEQLAAMRG